MTDINPDDTKQQGVVLMAAGGMAIYGCEAAEILAALRDYLEAQPRVIDLPAEDRTRKWRDRRGAIWMWEHEVFFASKWSDGDLDGCTWLSILRTFGPLTDAGPVDTPPGLGPITAWKPPYGTARRFA